MGYKRINIYFGMDYIFNLLLLVSLFTFGLGYTLIIYFTRNIFEIKKLYIQLLVCTLIYYSFGLYYLLWGIDMVLLYLLLEKYSDIIVKYFDLREYYAYFPSNKYYDKVNEFIDSFMPRIEYNYNKQVNDNMDSLKDNNMNSLLKDNGNMDSLLKDNGNMQSTGELFNMLNELGNMQNNIQNSKPGEHSINDLCLMLNQLGEIQNRITRKQ
jgi:hypothetical protein